MRGQLGRRRRFPPVLAVSLRQGPMGVVASWACRWRDEERERWMAAAVVDLSAGNGRFGFSGGRDGLGERASAAPDGAVDATGCGRALGASKAQRLWAGGRRVRVR